jgi:hypothetical protein
MIAAGTSLNASNWLGWAGASNWLHTAFLSINGTSTVAQTALAGWPTNWPYTSITNAPWLSAETDTLATVLARGNTSITQPTIRLGGNSGMTFLSGQLDLYDGGLTAFISIISDAGTIKLQAAGSDTVSLQASNITALGQFAGNGSLITNVNAATLGGVALDGLVQTSATAVVLVPGNNITINGGTSPVTLKVGETGTIASTASGGGITAFYWPHSRGVIPSGSGATRYGTDYQFTSFPTLTNSVLTFWNLPIVNTVSNLSVWSSADSGVATTTYLFAFAAYDGTTNAPTYTITNYVTAISGASKVTSNCTTAVTPGTWTMKMFPVSGSTNSLLSTVEGNIQ